MSTRSLYRNKEDKKYHYHQKINKRGLDESGFPCIVHIRYDDECGNGHNSFHIRKVHKGLLIDEQEGRTIDEQAELIKHLQETLPSIAHLFKWDFMSEDGPMHYIANTLWHAGDRDCWGLQEGEIKYANEEECVVYDCEPVSSWMEKYRLPEGGLPLRYAGKHKHGKVIRKEYQKPIIRTGEGKERDLDAARRTAVWPDATDTQLVMPREKLEVLLMKRLLGLCCAFRCDVEELGLVFTKEENETKERYQEDV